MRRKSLTIGGITLGDWVKIILVSAVTLFVVISVLYGAREMFIDTVHRSLH